jgi:hypothetical protein
MSFCKVDTAQKTLEKLKPGNFVKSQILERQHLQPLFRDNIQSIDPDLLIISEEFGNWEDSKRRIDLLALDKNANLVVIELKRVEDAGHSELQAIRYAAMVSTMDFEAVVSAYKEFLTKLTKPEEDVNNARSDIKKFLALEDDEEVLISNTPHIILIAPSFSQEITTTVLWLNEQGVDIRCIELKLYKINNEIFLNIEQIIPLPSTQDYQVKIREKTNQALHEASKTKRSENAVKILIANGLLAEGTKVYLTKSPETELDINTIDEKFKCATFQVEKKKFKWFDGKDYSLTRLCKKIMIERGFSEKEVQGPDYWTIEGQQKSISACAKEFDTDITT